ncbi:phosphoserine phosphatase SerB [Aromatoleum aromaticum]|uniref:Phosphoserine phosphatase n=1 Tax=Aromatoleum aromaticum (strain DSM 19018 / LMG 30748 / EbN1) TaxID=76114 RepID=Q5NZE3_AROAE|nr:phosphoserine phosphatase SerB [Aromatoleum aromaticum]NMG56594.1 phosphoserine phosphatase SerB [Aromatoleum aromaticum]CAI09571.1 phosphoserine phosphatase protein [Aromatoleum aromaticum EbN1]
MNLVVQGEDVDSVALKNLAKLTGASAIEQITAQAFRLVAGHDREGVDTLCAEAGLDWAWVPAGRKLADFGLFVTDMDSTLINIECIDEIADMQGLKPQVAAITEAAMRGEIDFRESLTRRVSLLAGLPEAALAEVYEQRLQVNPGAERLMRGLKGAGLHTVLVSGGFTYFTERLKARLGFDEAHANELETHHGRLTGRVRGAIVDGAAKAAHLRHARERLGLKSDQVIAAGDGANDIPMLTEAGFAVAYRAKPVLRTVADCRLDHVGLDGLLNLFT